MQLSIPTEPVHKIISELRGCIVNKDIIHLHIDELVQRIAELEAKASAEFVKKVARFGAPNGE